LRKLLPIMAGLVVVLVAAVPAVAQDESTDLGPPFDEAPGKDPEEEPLPEAPPEATVPEVPPDVLPEVGTKDPTLSPTRKPVRATAWGSALPISWTSVLQQIT
jgi:hypothetical protein